MINGTNYDDIFGGAKCSIIVAKQSICHSTVPADK